MKGLDYQWLKIGWGWRVFDAIEKEISTKKFNCAWATGVTSEAIPTYFDRSLALQIGSLLSLTWVQNSEKLPHDMILGMNVL